MTKRDEVVDFLFEVGQLKRTPRSGWTHLGIKAPESVADHSFRAAIVAYFLAKETGANPEKCATMCLFHELAETRVGDLNKTNKLYIDHHAVEAKAFADWKKNYPNLRQVAKLFAEFNSRQSLEAMTVRDAEIIEMVIQLKEYEPQVNREAFARFLKNSKKLLLTREGKKLCGKVVRGDVNWWRRAIYGKK